MDIESALIKRILETNDVDTWGFLRKNYLEPSYHQIYDRVDSFFSNYNKLPSFEELILDTRDKSLRDSIVAISTISADDLNAELLLEFLKNQKAQKLAFSGVKKLISDSRAFETAQDTVDQLTGIVDYINDQVDIGDASTNMKYLELFDSEEEVDGRVKMGLNSIADERLQLSYDDYILFGGHRGSGKSITGCNLAANAYNNGSSAIYFTIEMNQRQILQRICALSVGVPVYKLRNRNLSVGEWELVAKWWADRYQRGEEAFNKYLSHRTFDVLHTELKKLELNEKQIHIVYDPELTTQRIRSELNSLVPKISPSIIIVDYINQVKRENMGWKADEFDWKEQVQVSKFLKAQAQAHKTPVASMFQTTEDGQVRFGKGILDSADYAYNISVPNKEQSAIGFKCVKTRHLEEVDFVSSIDWDCVKIGPESVILKEEKEPEEECDDF